MEERGIVTYFSLLGPTVNAEDAQESSGQLDKDKNSRTSRTKTTKRRTLTQMVKLVFYLNTKYLSCMY